jgi:HlyD family secretion protein
VTPGLPLLEVGDPADIEAEIEMLSTDAVGVAVGAEVSIESWGGPRPLRGRVALVEPGGYTKISALGVEEQRVKVRVDFAEPIPSGLTLGDRFRVEARIVTAHVDRALQIPAGALFRRSGEWMTYLVDGGHARLTRVEIGRHNGQAAEVRNGLRTGQHMVLHPPDTLAEGTAVVERK